MNKDFRFEILIFLILIFFCAYRFFVGVEVRVLKIFSPTVFALDFNGNKSVENDEIVCVSGIRVFGENFLDDDVELMKKLSLSPKDVLSLGYLTKDFTNDFLASEVVEFVADDVQNNVDCVTGDIFVKNVSYKKSILNKGLAYSESDDFDISKFKEQVEKAKGLEPVVMNRKSKKYHKVGCKFGKIAQNSVVLLKDELPQKAIPCKWCHSDFENEVIKNNNIYPDRISAGFVKMYLTDMTNNLKVVKNCSSSVCQAFLNEINNAKESIDIATYGWVSIKELDDSIKSAVERGVKFRFVYDYSAKDSYYPDSAQIARLALQSKNDLTAGDIKMSEYLMHNKFMIFDNKKVATGSLNYSQTDFSGFNSNVVFMVDSPEIARVYTAEFEQMLAGKFHKNKKKRAKIQKYVVSDTVLEVYFSPQDCVIEEQVISYIDNAQKYIYMPVFVLTHKSLEKALIRAKERGVDVKIIVDATNVFAKGSSVLTLRDVGIPIKVENYAGKLHSKSIIIDDKYILAGSMNFSNSGEKRNDENMLIIKNPRLAVFYREYFEYLWGKISDKYLKQIPRAEGQESLGSCFDGLDNDFDGRIDKADEGCYVNGR